MSLCAFPGLAAIPAVLAAGLLLASFPVGAAPSQTSLGCSIKDIQSDTAAQCIKQAEEDILTGSATLHVVRCEAGKMHCCETVEDGVDITTCRYLGPLSISRDLNDNIVNGPTLKSTSQEPPGLSIGTPSR